MFHLLQKKKVLVFLILAISLFTCILNFRAGHNWGDDFSLYIMQSKAIVEGSVDLVYEQNKFSVNESSDHNFSPLVYPWGFPILLAPCYILFGMDYVAYKVLESLFLISFLLVMYIVTSKRLNWYQGLLLVAIVGLNRFYIGHINSVLSELPFLAFSWLSIHQLECFFSQKIKSKKEAIVTGLLVFFTFFIRTEGIGLLFSMFFIHIYYLCTKRKAILADKLINALPYFTFFVCYIVIKTFLPVGFTSHFSFFELVDDESVMRNLNFYREWIFKVIGLNNFSIWITVAIFFLTVVGLITRIKKDLIIILYFLFLVTLFTLWPFSEIRYLFSIIPLFLYFTLQGILFVKGKISVPIIDILCLVFSLIITISNLVEFTVNNSNNKMVLDGPEQLDSKKMFEFVRLNTTSTDVIAFFKPRAMTLYTNRRSLVIFGPLAAKDIKKCNYYVFNKHLEETRQPETNDIDFKELYTNNTFIVYKISN